MITFTKLLISFLVLTTFLISSYSWSQEITPEDLFEKSLNTKDTAERRILREEIVEKYPETEYGYFSKAYLESLRKHHEEAVRLYTCLLYTSPSPRDGLLSRMPSSA